MLSRIRSSLTYANAMSSIAVFIALGGSAYAVSGADIDDGTITTADIQGNFADLQNPYVEGTITTEDIANGMIFGIDIADNAIGGPDVASESLGGGDIADNSITGAEIPGDALDGFDIQNLTGADVVNDSLDGFDIQNLSGADVIDGSIGPEDLAPGAAGGGYGEVLTRHRQTTFRRGEQARVVADCPAGWIAVGGGYNSSQRRYPADLAVSVADRLDENSWIVIAKHVGGVGADRITLQASVNCLR